jgi:hypothetical protein
MMRTACRSFPVPALYRPEISILSPPNSNNTLGKLGRQCLHSKAGPDIPILFSINKFFRTALKPGMNTDNK